MDVVYEKNDIKLFEYDSFVYEVDLYTIREKMYNELTSTKYYKSDKLLNIKEYEVKILDKNTKQFKFTNLVGAPLDYLNNNYFKRYERYTKKELRAMARGKV